MSAVRTELRRLSALAIPVVVTQVGQMLLGVVDTIMVGHVSVEALGAATLGHIWIMATFMFAMGVVFGIDPIIAQAHGSGNVRRVALGFQRGMVMGLILSLPMAVLWLLCRPLMVLAGQDRELADLAQAYVNVQIPIIPVFLIFTACRQYLQGRGIVAPTMWISIVANGFNVVFNWALIFGHLGLPAMGLVGAGIASALTRVMMLVAMIAVIRGQRLTEGAWIPWGRDAFRLRGLREVASYGLPIGTQLSLEVWAFQIATLMAGWLGRVELAAHTVALNLASLSFMVPLGIALGSVTRIGNLLGAGRLLRAQVASWVAMAMGATVMILSAIVFVILRFRLPALYTPDGEVIAAAAAILPIAAAFQLFDGTQVVGGGVLRGMGRTRPAAVFNLVGYYVLALPLAWYLGFRLDHGLAGIWWGLALGLAAVAFMLIAWIARKGPAHLDPDEVRAAADREI